jgi:hypothetical protein
MGKENVHEDAASNMRNGNMQETVLATILNAVIGLIGRGAAFLKCRVSEAADRRRVYMWLRSNTCDEPGESHVDTITLAKGTRLPEERVRRACMSDQRIYRSSGEPERWSPWRQEPQSVYEKRGLMVV